MEIGTLSHTGSSNKGLGRIRDAFYRVMMSPYRLRFMWGRGWGDWQCYCLQVTPSEMRQGSALSQKWKDGHAPNRPGGMIKGETQCGVKL